MNNYEKIQYSMDLEEQKLKLEEQLEKVNEQIEQNKCNCKHIIATLGNKDTFPTYGKEYCCLLCGNHFQFFNVPKTFVDTRGFMKDIFDDVNPLERVRKFEYIQKITLEVLKNNPDMDNNELVATLNGMIENFKNKQIDFNESSDKNKSYTKNVNKSEEPKK